MANIQEDEVVEVREPLQPLYSIMRQIEHLQVQIKLEGVFANFFDAVLLQKEVLEIFEKFQVLDIGADIEEGKT